MLRKLLGRLSVSSYPMDPSGEAFVGQFPDAVVRPPDEQIPKNQLAFIGRSLGSSIPSLNVIGSTWPMAGDRPIRIVSFYTADNEYREHAERLRASLDRFGLAYELTPIDSRGAWEFNCAFKARYIRDQWSRSDVPVVWIDADATVEMNPILLNSFQADFAIHKWSGWQFASGTVYFGKSDLTRQLLDLWVLRSESDPTTYDQVHLQSAWCDISNSAPLRTVWLPRSYYDIFDRPGNDATVIRHWQASRKPKAEGRTTGQLQFETTSAGKRWRAANRLWRTPEESYWVNGTEQHPEAIRTHGGDFDPAPVLRSVVNDFPVLEIGCGSGRIAAHFRAQDYIGVDIDPDGLKSARTRLPGHNFRIHDDGLSYPDAPTVLFYETLLHVSDDSLPKILTEACLRRQHVIVVEAMNRRSRRPCRAPPFHRSPKVYQRLLRRQGLRLRAETELDLGSEAGDQQLTVLSFSR